MTFITKQHHTSPKAKRELNPHNNMTSLKDKVINLGKHFLSSSLECEYEGGI